MTDPNTKAAMEGITDEDLAGLTDEERAGLTEDVEEGEVEAEASAIDDAIAAITTPDKPAEAAATTVETTEETVDEPQRPAPVPLIRDEAPADAADKLAAIKAAKAELTKKLDDGEISTGDFLSQLDGFNAQASEIERAVFKSQLSREVEQQAATNAWMRDVGDFLAAHPELNANPLRLQSFDLVVRQVTADEANAKLSNTKQLEKALAVWTESLGVKAPAANDNPGKVAKPAAKERPAAPPVLSKLPASDMQDVDDGKYAGLDRLMETDPIGFENALARLTEAQQDEYYASR